MPPPSAFAKFAPWSDRPLLDWICSKVSREMIGEICQLDYGRDVAIHSLAIMRQIGPNPELGLLAWHPREVLELERWAEPDTAYLDRPPEGEKGHLKRLFACALLLRSAAYIDPDSSDFDETFFIVTSAATIAQSVGSAIALGDSAPQLSLEMFLWLAEKQAHPLLRPFAAYGAMLLQLQTGLGIKSEADVLENYNWVDEVEHVSRRELGEDVHSERWLVGLNYQEDDADGRGRWRHPTQKAIETVRQRFGSKTDAVLGRLETIFSDCNTRALR